MKNHSKKIIAPIVITALLICFFAGYIWLGLMTNATPFFIKVVILLVYVGLITLSINVLIERIKEIKDGEEDDLSKY